MREREGARGRRKDRAGFRFLGKPTNEGTNWIDRRSGGLGKVKVYEGGREAAPASERATDQLGHWCCLLAGLLQTAAGLLRPPPIERETGRTTELGRAT